MRLIYYYTLLISLQLIEELRRMSDQDEQARALLDRKHRIRDVVSKAESSIRHSLQAEIVSTRSISTKTINSQKNSAKKSPYKKF